jgi:ankyrin repeat protein
MIKRLILILLITLFLIGCTTAETSPPTAPPAAVEEPTPEPTAASQFATLSPDERNDALIEAIRGDDMAAIDELLALGADANYPEPSLGLSPLIMATVRSDAQMAQRLIAAGADVTIIDKGGNNLLHHAVDGGNPDLLALLLKQEGIYINLARDLYGSTPLIMAARDNNVAIVERLIDAGADLEIGDDWGDTPVNIAAYRGSLEALQLLIERGAAIEVINTNGNTALDHARNQSHEEIETFLLTIPEEEP